MNDGKPILAGRYRFSGEKNQVVLSADFKLRFIFPESYPLHIPSVIEVDGSIPSDYHRNPDSSLCLGTPAELYLSFRKAPTLDGFMRRILNPYLYRWLEVKESGSATSEDRSHGIVGLIESYSELLNAEDVGVLAKLIGDALVNGIRPNQPCTCGSGVKFKHCHMKRVRRLLEAMPQEVLFRDFRLLEIHWRTKK